VSAERFELSTNGLKGRCSAVELRARHKKADCILTWEIFIVNVRTLLPQKRQEKLNLCAHSGLRSYFFQGKTLIP
jgi:hypothetical protein